MDVSTNGQLLASSSGDYTVRLWQAESGAELLVRSGKRLGGQCVAIAADNELMAYGTEELSIEVQPILHHNCAAAELTVAEDQLRSRWEIKGRINVKFAGALRLIDSLWI